MKAFGYLRVSGKSQVDGDGFPRQRAAIQAYADAHQIEVIEWFEERGISGTNELEDRPALVALLEALLANGTSTVLVEKLDRLARDLMIQESILADFKKRGLTLISVAEPDLCSNEPSRVFMRQVFGAMAQYEKTMIVAKLRGARQRMKALTGRCEGQKPYGMNEWERKMIELMGIWRAQGDSFDKIADQLNAQSHRTRHGRKWYGCTVSKILAAQK
jgi:DNA invertase Pin-like site-specific DNA recombinase